MAAPTKTNGNGAMPAISDLFKQAGFELDTVRDEFETGAGPSFSVLSIRGSKFRVRRGGEETLVTNEDGDPVSALNAVLVRSNPHFSKAYYAKGYEEGDDDAPVCYSMDGVRPEPDSEQKQNNVCATCPKNMRGSRTTDSGQKLKACADVRRVAIVPYPDVDNEMHGGPMLMRVPAASLRPLAEYSQKLAKIGWPAFAVATKISFDPETSYPRLLFKPLKPLSDDEAAKIIALRDDERVQAILQTMFEARSDDAAGPGEPEMEAFEGKEPPAAVKQAAATEEKPKRQKPKPTPEPEPEPKQEPEQEETDEDEDDGGTSLPPAADTEKALASLLEGL